MNGLSIHVYAEGTELTADPPQQAQVIESPHLEARPKYCAHALDTNDNLLGLQILFRIVIVDNKMRRPNPQALLIFRQLIFL